MAKNDCVISIWVSVGANMGIRKELIMNDVESKTTQIEYSKEGIVQELALLKIKQEVNEEDSASGIAEKFLNYCDQMRAVIHD